MQRETNKNTDQFIQFVDDDGRICTGIVIDDDYDRRWRLGVHKTQHGYTPRGKLPPVYSVWTHMHQRCYNPRDKAFKYYGGRGIDVCPRWHRDNPYGFMNFRADMGEPPPGLTLHRIDNDKGYSLKNCKWATWKEQASNKRKPVPRVGATGVRGVTYDKNKRKYIAQICVNRRPIYLGQFSTPEQASRAYQKAKARR